MKYIFETKNSVTDAMMIGQGQNVTRSLVILDVRNMDNVRMEPAFVVRAGTESIAHYVSIVIRKHCSNFELPYTVYRNKTPSDKYSKNKLHRFVAGCENGCSRHGLCTLLNGEYSCDCSTGWAGRDCSIRLEMECNDEIDNDQGESCSKSKSSEL